MCTQAGLKVEASLLPQPPGSEVTSIIHHALEGWVFNLRNWWALTNYFPSLTFGFLICRVCVCLPGLVNMRIFETMLQFLEHYKYSTRVRSVVIAALALILAKHVP